MCAVATWACRCVGIECANENVLQMVGQALAVVLGIGFLTLQVRLRRLDTSWSSFTCGTRSCDQRSSTACACITEVNATILVQSASDPLLCYVPADLRPLRGGAGQLGGAAPAGGQRLRPGPQRVRTLCLSIRPPGRLLQACDGPRCMARVLQHPFSL